MILFNKSINKTPLVLTKSIQNTIEITQIDNYLIIFIIILPYLVGISKTYTFIQIKVIFFLLLNIVPKYLLFCFLVLISKICWNRIKRNFIQKDWDKIGIVSAVMSSWIALSWHSEIKTAFYTKYIKGEYDRIFIMKILKILEKVFCAHIGNFNPIKEGLSAFLMSIGHFYIIIKIQIPIINLIPSHCIAPTDELSKYWQHV